MEDLAPGYYKEPLSQRVVKGGVWVFALRITQKLLSLVRLIILARILAPNDFGLMGMALLTMAVLETFSQTGFQFALIQKKKDIESYLDSAWTVTIIRAVILFIILYLIAPYAAIFFKVSEAEPIIQVIGFSILLQALTNIGIIYFEKELEFKKLYIYQLSGTLADFIVAISAVFLLRNVWALVFGMLAGNLVRLIVSYLVHPYRPHLALDLGKAKELFGYGKWILGSSALFFLLNQGDDLFVGKFLGATMLGFYQMAYLISNIPATEITHVISQVTFPTYSKLQDNIPRLREAYLKVLQVTAFLSFPVAGLIFVLAPDFTKIFLGEKWLPMVPAMQVLVFWGLIRSIGATIGPLFQAVGRPDLITKLQVVKLIVLATLIYPLTLKWGILGTALAVVLTALVDNPIADYFAIKTVKCQFLEFGKLLLVPMLAMSIMLSALFVLKYILGGVIGLLGLFILMAVGIIVYLGVIQIIDLFSSYGINAIIRNQVTLFQRGR